jgi:hypothetical protein
MTVPGTIDPIREARAYQAMLVGLVGNDDPADVQRATPGRARQLLAEAAGDLRVCPAEAEWSVLECLAHLVDAELVVSGRYRWILAEDEPELRPYDQDLWVDRLHDMSEDPDRLLAVFEPLRAANIDLWARTPVEMRDRVGHHPERGPESYGLTFTMLAGHDRFHIAQVERALASIRSGR